MTTAIRSAQLPASRSCKRAVAFDPVRQVLSIVAGRRACCYRVAEQYAAPGFHGRAFRLDRVDAVGEPRNVLLAADRRLSSCDCEGKTYESSERAKRRALERGEEAVETLGCKHLDAVAHAVDQGWLPDPRNHPHSSGTPSDDELDEMAAGQPDEESGSRFWPDKPQPADELPACFAGIGGAGRDTPF